MISFFKALVKRRPSKTASQRYGDRQGKREQAKAQGKLPSGPAGCDDMDFMGFSQLPSQSVQNPRDKLYNFHPEVLEIKCP